VTAVAEHTDIAAADILATAREQVLERGEALNSEQVLAVLRSSAGPPQPPKTSRSSSRVCRWHCGGVITPADQCPPG